MPSWRRAALLLPALLGAAVAGEGRSGPAPGCAAAPDLSLLQTRAGHVGKRPTAESAEDGARRRLSAETAPNATSEIEEGHEDEEIRGHTMSKRAVAETDPSGPKNHDATLQEQMRAREKELESPGDSAMPEVKEEARDTVPGQINPAPHSLRYMEAAPHIKDGFYQEDDGSTPRKCFLSRKTLFMLPAKRMPAGCASSAELSFIAAELDREGGPCASCLDEMVAHLKWDNWKARTNELIKATETNGFQWQLPSVCTECDTNWNNMCLQQNVYTDQDFLEQRMFTENLAKRLIKHGVSLYLDFSDTDAQFMIQMYGGRDKAFSEPLLYEGMLALLAKRAAQADAFVKWEGAGGHIVQAEHSGVKVKGTTPQELSFAPIGDASPRPNADSAPECRYESQLGDASLPFASQICELCGGDMCGEVCEAPLLNSVVEVARESIQRDRVLWNVSLYEILERHSARAGGTIARRA